MGGYGYFVWMSMGATFLALLIETVVVRARYRAQKIRLRQIKDLAHLEEPQT